MSFNADAAALTVVALCAALVGVVAYLMASKFRARRVQREVVLIRGLIIEYFRRSGVAVVADCVRLDSGAFIAMVESEPMKRFRLSHIIEMTLCEHVRKASGLTLEKVYWRFPIKDAAQAVPGASDGAETAAADGNAGQQAGQADDYINEGLENYRHIPRPEVTELPWETFEEMSNTIDRPKQDKPAGE
jgi:hypothetical protein